MYTRARDTKVAFTWIRPFFINSPLSDELRPKIRLLEQFFRTIFSEIINIMRCRKLTAPASYPMISWGRGVQNLPLILTHELQEVNSSCNLPDILGWESRAPPSDLISRSIGSEQLLLLTWYHEDEEVEYLPLTWYQEVQAVNSSCYLPDIMRYRKYSSSIQKNLDHFVVIWQQIDAFYFSCATNQK